ncbi:hypothetical protein PoB_005108400 [Plakobranchus ocellatus]|uniref:Uncharacterized protein n=1 Tax=Plakobranchus ocellatus TaxID=259542 RepID=A0AAV4C0C9_9GAST|nr:hypothetical protein PoB_005108400 [Plakobranchus ocellatus]
MEVFACVASLQTSAGDALGIDSNIETSVRVYLAEIRQSLQSQNKPGPDSDEEPQEELDPEKCDTRRGKRNTLTIHRAA